MLTENRKEKKLINLEIKKTPIKIKKNFKEKKYIE